LKKNEGLQKNKKFISKKQGKKWKVEIGLFVKRRKKKGKN